MPGTLCSTWKWQDWLLNRDFPFAWEEQEGLQNTSEEVVSWGNGSKYGGGSEQRLLLRECFLFLLSKAHRG